MNVDGRIKRNTDGRMKNKEYINVRMKNKEYIDGRMKNKEYRWNEEE